ncbi:MAG: DUF421 domain-containing protein [Lactobacillus sp.]|nr:MAG: DUF421 domain-containing protein [Lactobacillus sp.]
MQIYYDVGLKLALGFVCLIAQINLTGKGNLAPSSAMDSVQNFVLGGIIGGAMFNSDITLFQFFLILVLWTLLVLVTKYAKEHNRVIKRMIDGQPQTVIKDGEIALKTVLRSGLSAADLMFKLRQNGVYSVKDVKRAVLEQNGQLTVTVFGDDAIKFPLITDGQINQDVLPIINHDEAWLLAQLKQQRVVLKDVYLAEYRDEHVEISAYQLP